MGHRTANHVLAFLLLSIVSLVVLGSGATMVETTTGSVLNGTMTGIAPLLCLNYSPHMSFDIPFSSVVQIIIDFPRVVVETATRIYIGPYSAFSGIDDVISLQQGDTKRDVPFASIRAIAPNGHSFHDTPRIWLKDGYLKLPAVLNAQGATERVEPTVRSQPVKTTQAAQTWDELYQTPTMSQKEETPWWVLLLITAGLGVLVYLSL